MGEQGRSQGKQKRRQEKGWEGKETKIQEAKLMGEKRLGGAKWEEKGCGGCYHEGSGDEKGKKAEVF